MNGITVIRKTVVIRRTTAPVTVIRHPNIVKVTANVPVIHKQLFRSFSLISLAGQTVFTLPSYPVTSGLMFCSINGTMQDPIAGDYVIFNNTLTVNAPLAAGDHLYGIFEQE